MSDQQINVSYGKSPLWRVVCATGAAVGGIAGSNQGMEVVIHFTYEWVDILNETFLGEINPTTGTYTIKAASQIAVSPLSKMEEVAVKMPAKGAALLVVGLLGQFASFSEESKRRIRDTFANLPTA
jgi:hypothetical protein